MPPRSSALTPGSQPAVQVGPGHVLTCTHVTHTLTHVCTCTCALSRARTNTQPSGHACTHRARAQTRYRHLYTLVHTHAAPAPESSGTAPKFSPRPTRPRRGVQSSTPRPRPHRCAEPTPGTHERHGCDLAPPWSHPEPHQDTRRRLTHSCPQDGLSLVRNPQIPLSGSETTVQTQNCHCQGHPGPWGP